MTLEEKIKQAVRDIPDFPKKGILFKDITTLLHQPKLCQAMVDKMADQVSGLKLDAIVGVESRGFLFGLPLAMHLGLPFVLVRKVGKLPGNTISYSYDLEYGSSEVEIHDDALQVGQRVLIHDDLLATGGTAKAAAELVKKCAAKTVAYSFLIELSGLSGRKSLEAQGVNIFNLAHY